MEQNYDSFNKVELLYLAEATSVHSNIAKLYLQLWDRNATRTYSLAKELLLQEITLDQKACVLQAAIAMTEIEYDLKMRKEFLLYWNAMGSLATSFYAQYLYFYQKGLSYFYVGAHQSALEQWEESLRLATENHYLRGEFRLKYHIGLIYKEKGYKVKALSYFNEAFQKASVKGATRFLPRIKEQIVTVEKGVRTFNDNQLQVVELLTHGLKSKARALTLKLCQLRRRERRHWDSQSEDFLLALVALAFKKVKIFNFIMSKISDDFVRLSIFEVVSHLKLIDVSFDQEIHFLRRALNISELNDISLPTLHKLNFESEEVSEFISLLESAPEGLTKEQICKNLWNYTYDPVIHDNKIYKLIHKTRKSLGLKALITNAYGGKYRINKDWLENK